MDWAGVGDTYFAMVVVPGKKLEGLELQTTQYDYAANGKPEKRYLVTAWVPIPTDGTRSAVYTGPKDHYLLTQASANLKQTLGRDNDLEGLIDYGWFSWMSRPLAVPILSSIKWLQTTDWQLWRSNYLIHDSNLFPVFSIEVALFEVHEEGAKACAEDEGAAGKDQGDEAKRSSSERIAGRAVAVDEGRKSARRLSPPPDSDAVSLRSLPGYNHLA